MAIVDDLKLTIIPLDTLRSIIGVDPYHFWGMSYPGHELVQCNTCYTHYRWTNSDQASRYDLINAVVSAEQLFADILGYYPGYKYTSMDEVKLFKPRQAVRYQQTPYTLQTRWHKISQVGIETFTLIQADKALVYVADVDDVSITQTVDAGTLACEIVICYPDTEVEIRPIEVSVSGTTATITVKRWLLGDPDNWETDDECEDASDTDNLLAVVDIYRKWYDPSSQITMAWEPNVRRCACFLNTGTTEGCTVCQGSTQSACAIREDFDLGVVAWQLADWDSDEEEYEQASNCFYRYPDLGYINYLHGAPSDPGNCYMSREWSRLVAILAVANMDSSMCACKNIQRFVEYWREDMSKSTESRTYNVSQSALESPVGGGRRGHVEAWNAIRRKNE